jgi:hypothetical protein
MADYKNIKGFNIQYLDSDPPNPIEGQMWFNSTSQTLKGVEAGGAPAGTWASGGSLNTGTNSQVGAGTQTAALNISGSSTARTTVVESYDGSSWSTVTSVNVARNEAGGCGTQTAALFVGGTSNNTPAIEGNTELYNGTSWTEVNNMTSARDNLVQAFGTQTASIVAGGAPGPVATFTESWNGTSWTEVSDLPAPRALAAQTGTQTAGLLISGFTTLPAYARPTSVLSWNGSSWTEIADVNSGRDRSLASGIQTAALLQKNGQCLNMLLKHSQLLNT